MRDDSRHRCSGVAIPRPTPTLQKEAPDEEEVQGEEGGGGRPSHGHHPGANGKEKSIASPRLGKQSSCDTVGPQPGTALPPRTTYLPHT